MTTSAAPHGQLDMHKIALVHRQLEKAPLWRFTEPGVIQEALMHAITLLGVESWSVRENRHQSQLQLVHYRGNVLQLIQSQLANFPDPKIDSTIAGIASLAIFEVCTSYQVWMFCFFASDSCYRA